MPTVKTYNLSGAQTGTIELDDALFSEQVKPEVIHQVVHVMRANQRQPIAHTKDRSEVRGGGRKPWKQKGTGRARHGSIRSPLWRGGGVTFGPRNINVTKLSLPRKMTQKALRAALSDRVAGGMFFVLDDVTLEKPQTKTMVALFSKLKLAGKKVLFLTIAGQEHAVLSVRNIPEVSSLRVDNINILDILGRKAVIINKDALQQLTSQLRPKVA